MKSTLPLLIAALLSTNAFAMGKKLPACSTTPANAASAVALCGMLTDFCGPHLGACTGGSDCSGTPKVGAVWVNDDQCVTISVANSKLKSEMQNSMSDTAQACVEGTENPATQVLAVTSACAK